MGEPTKAPAALPAPGPGWTPANGHQRPTECRWLCRAYAGPEVARPGGTRARPVKVIGWVLGPKI